LIHTKWALRTGAFLEDRPNYNHSDCFGKFPFPVCTEAQKTRIRELGEQLDAHRKRQQALHPKLTLTDMYNVLEKLRTGETLGAKEKTIHEQGLVSVLRQIHDDLDAAVFDAYGWPVTLTDDEILERLVALNAERAAEEARGLVRWLRPDFQNPSQPAEQQPTLALEEEEEEAAPPKPAKRKKGSATDAPAEAAKIDWPKGRAAQAKAVLAALRECEKAVTADELAQRFARPQRDVIEELLQALAALGQARKTRGGKFAC
jgi:hypothetical protein